MVRGRRGQRGQALILVLILLAVGSLLIVPTLLLGGTTARASQVALQKVKSLYAADGAQEWVLWKLTYDSLGSEFTEDGEEETFVVDVDGELVNITIVMRALEGEGGITLATDDVMRPIKSVTPSTVANNTYQVFTYTIKLEQLSENTSVGLDAIYDILPKGFGTGSYIAGSSYLRVDGGPWQSIADPSTASSGGQERLRWPASGNFPSPIRDFEVRQVKELKFQVAATLPKNSRQGNWAVLKPWDTLSGPQAAITVGTPSYPGFAQDGLLDVQKSADIELIQPGVPTPITYTISITNWDGSTNQIQEIRDYLPSGFTYTGPTSGLTTIAPLQTLETINGVQRWKLHWTTAQFPGGNAVSIAAGQTLTLVFTALTSQEISGSYYNEVLVLPNRPVPTLFSNIDISAEEYNASCYSWNSGMTLVPFFDSRADADEADIDANIALIIGGVAVKSWQVR